MPKAHPKNDFSDRQVLMVLLSAVVIFGYIGRLFYLQIISDEYTRKAERNAFYYRIQYPARGAIFDRNDKLVVYNEPVYDIMVTMHDLSQFDTIAFCNLLGVNKTFFDARLAAVTFPASDLGHPATALHSLFAPEVPFHSLSPLRFYLCNPLRRV